MLWVHTCDALAHALLLRSERSCSVTQHQVSVRQSACTHEKEDLTTSRFVSVIYSSQNVSIKLGTVTKKGESGNGEKGEKKEKMEKGEKGKQRKKKEEKVEKKRWKHKKKKRKRKKRKKKRWRRKQLLRV